MDYGDNYWELYRDYYRDPFPHSPPSTRQIKAPNPKLPRVPLTICMALEASTEAPGRASRQNGWRVLGLVGVVLGVPQGVWGPQAAGNVPKNTPPWPPGLLGPLAPGLLVSP